MNCVHKRTMGETEWSKLRKARISQLNSNRASHHRNNTQDRNEFYKQEFTRKDAVLEYRKKRAVDGWIHAYEIQGE